MSVTLRVITLFILLFMGYFSAKKKIIGEEAFKGMNTLVLFFAQPCLAVSSLQTAADKHILPQLLHVFIAAVVVMTLSGLFAWQLFRNEEAKRRSVLTSMSMISNCGFMGYPVIIAALGQDALIYAVIYGAAFNLVGWTLGSYYYGGIKAVQPLKMLTNPTLLATIAGFALFLMEQRIPAFIEDAIDMMGNTCTPLAMFIIGARLVSLSRNDLKDRHMLTACLLRLVVVPVITLLVLKQIPVSREVVQTVFLCTAMPCASLTAMHSELYRSDALLASRGVALSTALSMISLPLLLLMVA